MIKIRENVSKKKKPIHSKTKKRYFNVLLVFYVLLFIFILSSAIYLLKLSLTVEQDIITYKENGNVDYKVYLNSNDFYDQDYLEKDMIYVSSLINNIAVSFNYDFDINSKTDIDYSYEIVGEIIIYDNLKENVFFRKQYVLAELAEQKLEKTKEFSINKSVNVDYNYYNSLANKFKKNYGVSSKSDFIVKLNLKYKNNDENLSYSGDRDLSLTVPLSENEVTIATDNSSVKNMSNIVLGKKHVAIENYGKLAVSIILAFISLILFIHVTVALLEMRTSKSKYDIFIKKTLREYDRLIVDTTTPPSFLDRKVIKINSFEELIDVRDNLNIPIMYYVEKEHEKCVFYLNHRKEIYVLNVTAKDFEKK